MNSLNKVEFLQSMIQSGMGISSSTNIHINNRNSVIAYRNNVPIINLNITLDKWIQFLFLFKNIEKVNGKIAFMCNKQSIHRYGQWISESWHILPLQWKPGTLSNSKSNYDLIIFLHLNSLDQQSAALEAKKLSIPSAGFLATDLNPNIVDYSFLANTDSFTSLDFFFNILNKRFSLID